MLRRLPVAACFVLFAACQKSDTKVLIGAATVVAPGAVPIEDSVIVVAGRTVRSVGLRKDVPIPQDSERIGLTGKWIVPAPGGRIAAGESGDLLVLDRAPNGAVPVNPSDVSKRLTAGQWQAGK